MLHPTIFSSFFMGGFEACYARSEHGKRHDMLRLTKHDVQCRSDYKLLKDIGITTVRESLSWHQIDKGNGQYDFAFFEEIMQIAKAEDMQVIWGLNHFDLIDIDPFSPVLVERFVAYAVEAVKTIRRYTNGILYLIPFNEMSFFSWISAEIGVWGPYAHQRGGELKIQLTKCVIGAIQAIRKIDPSVRFIHIDPIMNRTVQPGSEGALQRFVDDFREIMYEAWDMVSGRVRPELGGQPYYMDAVGLNYYIYNQEEVTIRYEESSNHPHFDIQRMDWDSPLWRSMNDLMQEVYERYKVPILITETGCHGSLREQWWNRLLPEVDLAIAEGIQVLGLCSYPIIDRPDWHQWHLTNSGFWDFAADDPNCTRIPQEQVLRIIREYLADDRQMVAEIAQT